MNKPRNAHAFVTKPVDKNGFDLPAIGLRVDGQIVSGAREGKTDSTSLAVHPGEPSRAEKLAEVRFVPTTAVQFRGSVKELGVHCGGVDVWVYGDSSLLASKKGLNNDDTWSFASPSSGTTGTIRVFIGAGGDYNCNHSQVSLTVVPAKRRRR